MPSYDPDKNYQWKPDDTFEIKGHEFADFFHLLTQEMHEKGGAPIAMKVAAFTTMRKIFDRSVENGLITEQKESDNDNVKDLFAEKS